MGYTSREKRRRVFQADFLDVQRAECSVQSAACTLQRAPCTVQRAPCSVHRAACTKTDASFAIAQESILTLPVMASKFKSQAKRPSS